VYEQRNWITGAVSADKSAIRPLSCTCGSVSGHLCSIDANSVQKIKDLVSAKRSGVCRRWTQTHRHQLEDTVETFGLFPAEVLSAWLTEYCTMISCIIEIFVQHWSSRIKCSIQSLFFHKESAGIAVRMTSPPAGKETSRGITFALSTDFRSVRIYVNYWISNSIGHLLWRHADVRDRERNSSGGCYKWTPPVGR